MDDQNKVSKLSLLFADSIMTENVSTIKKDMKVGQVAHLMLRERVSGYPIVNDSGAVVGIITLTDLFSLMYKMLKDSKVMLGNNRDVGLQEMIAQCKEMSVGDIMSKEVICVSPETAVIDMLDAFVEKNIRTFPVMKDNKLVGIVGRHDLLNAMFVYG